MHHLKVRFCSHRHRSLWFLGHVNNYHRRFSLWDPHEKMSLFSATSWKPILMVITISVSDVFCPSYCVISRQIGDFKINCWQTFQTCWERLICKLWPRLMNEKLSAKYRFASSSPVCARIWGHIRFLMVSSFGRRCSLVLLLLIQHCSPWTYQETTSSLV